MIDSSYIPTLGLAIGVGMAFVPAVRYELLKRDRWTCQNENCIGNYMDLGALNWRRGWNVNGAHYPNMHQKEPDRNMDHGRCLCVHCHIIEEIERGNHSGAGLLYEKQTIRNKEWLHDNGWRDQKPPITFYYDWVRTDEAGRSGLAQAYIEKFNLSVNDNQMAFELG